MSWRRIARIAGLALAAAAVSTCDDATAPTASAGIDVTPAVVAVGIDRSVQLTAVARDGAGAAIPGARFTFESDAPTIASVSSTGRVTGVAPGRTVVTVTGHGASARVPVRVGSLPATIEVTPADADVVQGTTLQLVATVRDSQGAILPDPLIAFATTDAALATVTQAGVVSGVAPGPVSIIVSAPPATLAVPLAVLGHPQGTEVVGVTVPAPFGVAVSPAGVVYVTSGDQALRRADLPGTAFAATVTVGQTPTDVAFDPSGARAYVTNQLSQQVGIVDVATNTQVDVIPVGASPFRVLVSPAGQRLYVTTNAGELLVIALPSKAIQVVYLLGSASNGLAFHPDGVLLYGTTMGGLVFEINTATDSARGLLTTGVLQDIAVSRDGSELYIAKEDGNLEIRSVSTGALKSVLSAAAGAFGLRLSPDGRQLYAGIVGGGVVRVIDPASRGVIRSIQVPDPRRIAFDRYGTTALITSQATSTVHVVR
jgi:YVTN family beta-propeller protein